MNKNLIKNTILMALLTSVSNVHAGFKDTAKDAGKFFASGLVVNGTYYLTDNLYFLGFAGAKIGGGIAYNLFGYNFRNANVYFTPGFVYSYSFYNPYNMSHLNSFNFPLLYLSLNVLNNWMLNVRLGVSFKDSENNDKFANVGAYAMMYVDHSVFSEKLRLGGGWNSTIAKLSKDIVDGKNNNAKIDNSNVENN